MINYESLYQDPGQQLTTDDFANTSYTHIGYNQLYKVLLWFFNDFIIYNLTDYASSFKITLVK